MKGKIPDIKKKMKAFFVGEEGKISKQSLLKIGAIVGASAIGAAMNSKKVHSQANTHTNTLSIAYASPTATATHVHHASHSSHNSHGSHSSHGSHGQW